MSKSYLGRLVFALLLAALSGVLLALALPPRDLAWLGWVAFLPLLIASRLANSSLLAALCGVVAGVVCGVVLSDSLASGPQFGNQIAAFGGLGLVLAFVAGWSSFASRKMSSGVWAVFVACVAVTAELMSPYVFPVNAAITQHRNTTALYAASFAGIWGVSFALWLAPAAVIALFSQPRSVWPALCLVALATSALVLQRGATAPTGETVGLAAVQAQDIRLAAKSTRALAHKADVVVWPELLTEPDNSTARDAARHTRVYLVASFVEPRRGARPHNAAHVISPSGRRTGIFRKRRLFGKEYVVYARGNISEPVRCGRVRVGVPICFDTEFTDVTRDLVRRGADVIMVPNSDPQTPNNLFNHLHSAVIPFRAAENGVPIAWSEPTFGSIVVDSLGRVVGRASAMQGSIAFAEVHPRTRRTLFTVAGDYFAYLCVVSALGLALTAAMVRGRRTPGRAPAVGAGAQ